MVLMSFLNQFHLPTQLAFHEYVTVLRVPGGPTMILIYNLFEGKIYIYYIYKALYMCFGLKYKHSLDFVHYIMPFTYCSGVRCTVVTVASQRDYARDFYFRI